MAGQDSGCVPGTVMEIVHPHGYLLVSTHTDIVPVPRQAETVTHMCKGSHPHSLTSHMSLSPWSPHLPVSPTHSHTHRELGCWSLNLEFYTADHSILQQWRQVHLYVDGCPPPPFNVVLPLTEQLLPPWTDLNSSSHSLWENYLISMSLSFFIY